MKSGKIQISRFAEGLTVFKPDYYLNRGKKTISDLIDKGVSWMRLSEISDKLYQGGIFKRVFNEEGEKAYKYITASDMVKSQPLDSAKNISKKFTPWVDLMTLKSSQVLVSCAGSVGNTVLVNESFAGCIGSQEIIRIETTKIPYGFCYAYISSSFAYEYIQSMIYGAVVPRISPDELGRLPILLPGEAKQQEIHKLIAEASSIRVEANKLLKGAINEIDEVLRFVNERSKIIGKSSIKSLINNYQQRLDSPSYVNQGVSHYSYLKTQGFEFLKLKKMGFKVTRPGIFKRVKVSEKNGLPYIKGSELNKLNPFDSCEYLSKTKTPFLNELKLRENQILFTCAGTVGDVKLISKEYEERNSIGSQDIIRIEQSKAEISIFYLFAYLKTDFIQSYIQSLKYGSVIERVEPFHVDMIPVFLVSKDRYSEIVSNVEQYKNLLYKAFKCEEKAIDLVEKEIESWQES